MKVSALWLLVALVVGLAIGYFVAVSSVEQNDSSAVMLANGQEVVIADLVRSPVMRPTLQEYLELQTALQHIEEIGYELNTERATELFQTEVDYMITKGNSVENELRRRRLTQDEDIYIKSLRVMMEDLAKQKIEITEDMLTDLWNRNQEALIVRYLTRQGLPQSEAEIAKVTAEDVREIMEEQLIDEQLFSMIQVVRNELLAKTSVELTCIEDPQERQLFEDLIINFAVEDAQSIVAATDALAQ